MGYAFISYSSKNRYYADSMKRIFSQNGIDIWMAPDNIPVGSKYAEVINRAIKGCECVVLIWTNDAQDSVWVPKELERAINYRKVIVCLQMEDVVLNDEFELYLSSAQIMALRNIDENSPEVRKVLSVIRSIIGEKELIAPLNDEVSVQPAGKRDLLNDYIKLINSITITEWNKIQNEIGDENYSSCLFEGIFFIYRMAMANDTNEDKTGWRDRLSFYESLHLIASRRGLDELCAFFCDVTAEEVIRASENIKEYMRDNIDCFGNKKNGLDNVCFKMLMFARDDASIRRSYWEIVLKETYELFRMIKDRGNS